MAAAAAAEAAEEDEEAAFEAFACCDFLRASSLALAELAQQQHEQQEDGKAPLPLLPAAASAEAVRLTLPGVPPDTAAVCTVALTEACSRADKLAAVALQCGLELRRDEEARAVGHYYAHGDVPFPVAMIW